jgi:Ca2+:H+ antiporter
LSTLLFLVVVAILLPAAFGLTEQVATPGAEISLADDHLSLSVSVVLLLYGANLVYTLVTHRDVFAANEQAGEATWGFAQALIVMIAGTAVIALEAELVSGALEATAGQLRLAPVFSPRTARRPGSRDCC